MRYFNYEFFSGRKDQNHWIAEVMRVQISNSWNEHKYNIAFVFFLTFPWDLYCILSAFTLLYWSLIRISNNVNGKYNAHQVYF